MKTGKDKMSIIGIDLGKAPDITVQINPSISIHPTTKQIIKDIVDNMPKRKCLIGALTTNGGFTAFSADYPLKRISDYNGKNRKTT